MSIARSMIFFCNEQSTLLSLVKKKRKTTQSSMDVSKVNTGSEMPGKKTKTTFNLCHSYMKVD